jgi:hypothetical protein
VQVVPQGFAWFPAAHLAAASSSSHAELGRRAVEVVGIMLVHDLGCQHPQLWQMLEGISLAHPSTPVFRVCVHLKRSVPLADPLPGRAFIQERLLPTRVDAEWGQPSLTLAMLESLAAALQQYPSSRMFYFLSGLDVPMEVSALLHQELDLVVY